MAKESKEPKNSPVDPVADKARLDRAKALDSALAQIERQFGKGSVMKMGEIGRAHV